VGEAQKDENVRKSWVKQGSIVSVFSKGKAKWGKEEPAMLPKEVLGVGGGDPPACEKSGTNGTHGMTGEGGKLPKEHEVTNQ